MEIARLEEEFRRLTEENRTLMTVHNERAQQLERLCLTNRTRQDSSWPLTSAEPEASRHPADARPGNQAEIKAQLVLILHNNSQWISWRKASCLFMPESFVWTTEVLSLSVGSCCSDSTKLWHKATFLGFVIMWSCRTFPVATAIPPSIYTIQCQLLWMWPDILISVSGPAETQIFYLRSVEGAKGGMMWSKCRILRSVSLPSLAPRHLPVKFLLW